MIGDTYHIVIRSVADKRTAAFGLIACRRGSKRFGEVSRRKRRLLAAATLLEDLREPPGNHLEALSGDRAGQHSSGGRARHFSRDVHPAE
jgi:proteic killer suppression protein